MRAIIATTVFSAVAIALLVEVMTVAVTLGAMQHVASYHSWMTL
ncbi:hypothetical protein MJC1_02943 [Methylocystis sp. MJC1]|jgi:hypothetical protein|nr:hypothetical protein [Methylocystis sp. MJC1]KAF2990026.1 hypothetical protein MJC1_02943 [Methylocystis sp. MJC1]